MKTSNTRNGCSAATHRQIDRQIKLLANQHDELAAQFQAARTRGENLSTLAEKYDWQGLPTKVKSLVWQDRAKRKQIPITITVDPMDFGHLAAGAKLHGCTPEEMAGKLLYSTLSDWSTDGYPLND